MAGLGSACNHVAALLFKIEKAIHVRETDDASPTSIACQWKSIKTSLEAVPTHLINFSRVKKDDLTFVPSLSCSYLKNFLSNNPMAEEIPLTKEELKDLYTIKPETVLFTTTEKTDFLTESQPEYSQTDTASESEFELPELLVSLFDPTAINISNENLKTLSNKKYVLYQKAYSIESDKTFLIVTEKQALNPLWMLHRAGLITASKCYDVYQTDTEKVNIPSLLATIMEYSETKSNKYTRYGNDNESAARKYFAETQHAHHVNLIVNATGFKVHTEHPCIGASLDDIVPVLATR